LMMLGIVSSLLSPIVGPQADKFPARTLLLTGLSGLVIFHIGVSCMTAPWQYILLCAVVFSPSITLAASLVTNKLVSGWFVKNLGLALGLSAFGLGFAGVILPKLIATFVPLYGWRMVWRFAGLFILVVIMPLVAVAVRDRPTERDGFDYLTGGESERRPSAHGGSGARGGSMLGWRDMFSRRNFWVLVIAYVPMLALHGSVQNNLAPIANNIGLNDQAAATLLGAFSMSYVLATLLMGALSDNFGNRIMLCGLGIVTGFGALFVAFGHSLVPLIAGVIMVGVNGGMWPLLASAISREFGSENFGKAFGTLMLFVLLDVIAPVGVAVIKEVTGSYVPGLSIIAALSIIAGFVALLLNEKRAGQTEVSAR
ncbi:MAG: MFS transporter, partial [Alphaproteobacteria bacterium]|nr:MFS transporter [Alphaproteobacteria bacterium]